jgi:hypothetical protein
MRSELLSPPCPRGFHVLSERSLGSRGRLQAPFEQSVLHKHWTYLSFLSAARISTSRLFESLLRVLMAASTSCRGFQVLFGASGRGSISRDFQLLLSLSSLFWLFQVLHPSSLSGILESGDFEETKPRVLCAHLYEWECHDSGTYMASAR